jgi:hypothetical protein
MLKDVVSRRQIEELLRAAFSDREFSWLNAFKQYEVYPADDESDARDYAIKILWNAVFPGREPPKLQTEPQK